ncbi:MAG: hypothetical protein QNJ38_13245 [Prochloraceae cyanobacterium]|nr:hypothetical protein [Prochloraceae cyanobacterium]
MSKISSDDDRNLVAFLQQYRPIPPPANGATEDRLMQIIEEKESKKTFKFNPLIAVFSTVIIGSIFSLFSYRLFTPNYTNAQLESFMANSWDSTLEATYDDDWFLLSDREVDSDFSTQ